MMPECTPPSAATLIQRNRPSQIPDDLLCFELAPGVFAWASQERADKGIGMADDDVWYERVERVAERRVERALSPDQLAGDLPTVGDYERAGVDLLDRTPGGRADRHARWLSDVFELRGLSVLDHGCACGRMVRAFGSAGAKVSGCDDRAAFIARGLQNDPELATYLECCPASKLPYADGVFDFVHADFWPLRWNELQGSFREIRRVLVTGALLYLRVDTRELMSRRRGRGVVPTTSVQPHLGDSFVPTLSVQKLAYRPGAEWIVAAERAGLKNVTAHYLPDMTKHPDAGTRWYDWWVAVFQTRG